MSGHRQPPAALDWGLLALLGVVWGGAFLGVELALDSLAPIWVATAGSRWQPRCFLASR